MPFSHSKKAVFKLDNLAGALQDITQYLVSVGIATEYDVFGVPDLLDDIEPHVVGLGHVVITLRGRFDPTINTQLGAIVGEKTGTRSYEYGPQGQTAGKPQIIGECKVRTYHITSDFNEASGWDAELLAESIHLRGVLRQLAGRRLSGPTTSAGLERLPAARRSSE